jgi:hypothetical protein
LLLLILHLALELLEDLLLGLMLLLALVPISLQNNIISYNYVRNTVYSK